MFPFWCGNKNTCWGSSGCFLHTNESAFKCLLIPHKIICHFTVKWHLTEEAIWQWYKLLGVVSGPAWGTGVSFSATSLLVAPLMVLSRVKNVNALYYSSPLCDGEIHVIWTNLYIAHIPTAEGIYLLYSITMSLKICITCSCNRHTVTASCLKTVWHAGHCIMLVVCDEETLNCLIIFLFMDYKNIAIFIVWAMSVSHTAFFIEEMKRHFFTGYHNHPYAVTSWLKALKFWSGEGKDNTEIMSFP
jgi:hypothetical protein